MKKLLIILLLFFPFHEAWAEEINIKCIFKKGSQSVEKIFFIDDKKRLVNGMLLSEHDKITDTEIVITKGSIDLEKIQYWKYSIVRHSGDATLFLSKFYDTLSTDTDIVMKLVAEGFDPSWKTTMDGKCEKYSGKKKF